MYKEIEAIHDILGSLLKMSEQQGELIRDCLALNKWAVSRFSNIEEKLKELKITLDGVGDTVADNGERIDRAQRAISEQLDEFQRLRGDFQELENKSSSVH